MNQLNKALAANALFSLSSGIAALIFQAELAPHIPLPTWMWWFVGLGLIGFSAQLILMIKHPVLSKKLIFSVIYADTGWVLGSVVLSIIYQPHISAEGLTLIAVISTAVASLATAQYRGHKALILGHPSIK